MLNFTNKEEFSIEVRLVTSPNMRSKSSILWTRYKGWSLVYVEVTVTKKYWTDILCKRFFYALKVLL